jgi:hypothetical protein
MIHELKIHPSFFMDVMLGIKKFEIRLNDRNFQERDYVVLKEWNPETQKYTGRQTMRIVSEVFENLPGLQPNYVILQLKRV